MTARLFVYGTLQPGATHWHLLEPYVTGTPQPAQLRGTLYDTGRGYPALRLGPGPGVSGWLVQLRDPTELALSAMDEYEGPEYRRVHITLPDNTQAWTYIWAHPTDNLRPLTNPWPTTGSPRHP